MLDRLIFLVLFCIIQLTWGSYFDEHMLYNLEWPGKLRTSLDPSRYEDGVYIATNSNENYVCYVPRGKDATEAMDFRDSLLAPPNEIDLLRPLFDKDVCVHKVTSYWTYELCHGKSMRQYHKEEGIIKVSSSKIITEASTSASFILGKYPEPDWRNQKLLKERYKMQEHPPSYRFARVELPYYPVDLEPGDICDLTGMPRQVRVFYFCRPDAKAEFYDIQETSTCAYEVLVFTSYLCDSKKYRADASTTEISVKCYSSDDSSPSKPADLTKFLPSPPRYRDIFGQKPKSKQGDEEAGGGEDEDEDEEIDDFWVMDQFGLGPAPDLDSDDPFSKFGKRESLAKVRKAMGGRYGYALKSPPAPSKPLVNNYQPIKDFLKGTYCLHGGAQGAWWRYELCFGQYARQYHDEISESRHGTSRTEVSLGRWKAEKHMAWLDKFPSKRPKKPIDRRLTLSYMYSDGDICDATGLPRHVVVKLRCNPNDASEAISISLEEPSTCMYEIDVIAGRWLCRIVRAADDDGIFDLETAINYLMESDATDQRTNSAAPTLTESAKPVESEPSGSPPDPSQLRSPMVSPAETSASTLPKLADTAEGTKAPTSNGPSAPSQPGPSTTPAESSTPATPTAGEAPEPTEAPRSNGPPAPPQRKPSVTPSQRIPVTDELIAEDEVVTSEKAEKFAALGASKDDQKVKPETEFVSNKDPEGEESVVKTSDSSVRNEDAREKPLPLPGDEEL